MNKRLLNNKFKAFSLVEITIVCGVLLVLLVPIFNIMSKGNTGTLRNRNEILAQQYASNLIAFCNALKFDDDYLKAVENKIVNDEDNNNNKIKAGDYDILPSNITEEYFKKIATTSISIVDFDDLEVWPFRYKLVTVKVEWLQPGEKNTRNVTISGIVSER